MIMMEIIQSDQSIVHGTVGTVPFTVSAVEITFGPPPGQRHNNKKQETRKCNNIVESGQVCTKYSRDISVRKK